MSSALLPAFQKYIRASQLAGQLPGQASGKTNRQFVRSPQFDEKAGFDQDQHRLSSAELLEPTMRANSVGECAIADNQFQYFMDGIQRSWMLYYQNFAPVYYGYVAGVIRHRVERILSTWKYHRDEALYLPCKDFDPDEIRRLQEQGFTLRDTSINLSSSESHPENQNPENKNLEELNNQQPLAQRESAVQAITKQRERLEAGLAREWIGANPSGWLVMDGSISISPLTSAHPNIVGLIKSHNTQYFGFPEQEVIFNLKQGERSSIFQPKGRYPVCSWYLRSRDNTNQDLYFGLIRVEVAIGCQDRADEISRWILTERRPLSLPDARWDKMIYPIRDCEQFLRSQEPSRASLGWLDQ